MLILHAVVVLVRAHALLRLELSRTLQDVFFGLLHSCTQLRTHMLLCK